MDEIRLECVTGYPSPHCDGCNPCDVARLLKSIARDVRLADGRSLKAFRKTALEASERIDAVFVGDKP